MRISLIGVPMYLGANRPGVDLGPTAIRYTGIAPKLRDLGHDVGPFETIPVPDPAAPAPQDAKLKYVDEIMVVANDLATCVRRHILAGALPIMLGGDHSIALGSVSGASQARQPLGVIWMDTHGDFNDVKTTPSGHIHGMILGALCGFGDAPLSAVAGGGPHVAPDQVVIVGAREFDPGEKRRLSAAGVHVLTMAEIDRRGMADVMRQAIELASAGTAGIHVSFDLDVLDPREAPGVGTPVPGGITLREAHLAMEMIASSNALVSLDLVEVNPLLDVRNQTAELAVELALSAVGKCII
ncbi:MAG: arginase [Ktedonobacterales bacterium]|nr:arginase [Ktedonobacterales bacterium]